MGMFLLTGTDPETYENDRALLIICETREEAHEFWRSYYWEEDADEFETYSGPVLDEKPETGDCMVIWRVHASSIERGVLEWHSDGLKVVGYLAEAKN